MALTILMALTKSPISRPKSPVYHLPFLICHFLLVIGHLSLVICLPACTHPDDTWDRVRAAGVLRVGMDASFPPFETIAADGTLAGFDVDLAQELGQRLGVDVQFVANLPYDGLYDALAVGRVDVVISALVVNPSRMADFAYSAPYFDAGQVLVVREWETGVGGQRPEADGTSVVEGACPEPVEGMADLGGRTLAVEFGTRGDLEARKWARRLSGLAVVPYQTAAEALAAVEARAADAALVDHVSAKSGAGRGLVVVGEPVVEEPYAVAVHRESRYLLRAIDDALAEMEADGTMEALTEKWLRGG
jgi:ABC-type amino acid transport substrate-binding protein